MKHLLKLHVLASGSCGNAAVIEDSATGTGIMVDCGICKRDFFERCDEVGFNPQNLAAILITHDHTDHTKGLGVVMRGLAKRNIAPVLYADNAVRAASNDVRAIEDVCEVRPFSTGEALSLAGISAYAFRTSHDAASSCGFRFESADGDTLGFATDTGIVTKEMHEGLWDVRILALESNHDITMLKNGPYPYSIKMRIGSDEGHLSNNQAAAELNLLLTEKLEQVVAMHISQNNNTYRIAVDALSNVVQRAGHPASVCAAYQAKAVSIG